MAEYTKKIMVPQYIPKMKDKYKDVDKVVNVDKYMELVDEINASNVSDKEKDFLKLAATRHIKFNYSDIAEYYCHANEEMQELMEKSALVIIDVDDAIANGYVRLSKRIKEIIDSRAEE